MRAFICVLSLVSVLWSSDAIAQTDDLQTALEDPYVKSGLEVLDLIYSGEAEIDQNDLFLQIIARAEGAKESGLLIETELLSSVYNLDELEERFFSLPPVGEWPEVSVGAKMLVAAAIIDVSDTLKEQGVEPSVEDMLENLGPSMYLMMASAADQAISNQEQVNYVSIRRGGVFFFSLGWPFCCAQ